VRVRDRSEVTPGGPERSPLGGFNSALDALLASLQLAAGHGLDDDIALLLLRPELKPGKPTSLAVTNSRREEGHRRIGGALFLA